MKIIWIVAEVGQLGNRLHTFANLICLAKTYGYVVVNLSFGAYRTYFTSTSGGIVTWPSIRARWPHFFCVGWLENFGFRLLFSKKWVRRLRFLIEVDSPINQPLANDDQNVIEALMSGKMIVWRAWDIWFRSGMRRDGELLRRFFEPRPEVLRNAREFVSRIRSPGQIVVGVHIRRGDYKQYMEGRYYYEIGTYRKLMTSFQEIWGPAQVCFLICSNEFIGLPAFAELDVVKGPGGELDDLCVLSLCDYILGPPSTFSAWASYYGKVPRYEIVDPKGEIVLENFIKCEEC